MMIKTLLKSIREYKKKSIITIIFTALEVIIECIIPFVMALLIDSIEKESALTLFAYGFSLLLLAFSSLYCGIMAGRCAASASCGFAKNLRHDLYYAIQDYGFEDVDKFSQSSLVTRLTTDVSNTQMAYQMCTRIVIRVPLMIIFSFVMSLTINAKLSLIFLGMLPVILFVLFMIVKVVNQLFQRIFKKYDNLNNSVQENVSGIRIVKSLAREDFEKRKFDAAAVDVRDNFTKAERLVALNSPIMNVCIHAATLLVSFFGAKVIISTMGSELSPGKLSSLINYGVQILSSLMMVSMIFVMLSMSVTSAKRITEVINHKVSLKSPEDGEKVVKDGSIIFDNVSFKYSKQANEYALKNINLEIKSGETVGIIGGTGSSKSTLVQLIPRLFDVNEGNVLVGGINVKKYDLDTLRNEVAMVLQKNVLFSGTVKENLRWGNKAASDEELVRACKLAQADEFVSKFSEGYDTYIEQGGANVSGGQKQRLCIARALLKKPKVLILDDSTSAVDTKTDALIRRAFKEEIPNTTKIIIAQRVSSIQESDKIVVLDDGRIVGLGTHDELLKNNEIYQEVYYSQVKSSKKGSELNG
jgi:ATP-binding cassette subfamily B protein